MTRKKLYLAGPLFTPTERDFNSLLTQVLENWCDVYLPQRDGQLVTDLIGGGESIDRAYQAIFKSDIAAIAAADGLVINLDGRTVDEGAAFELGFAHALGRTCVGVRTDTRVLLPYGINPMVHVSLQHIFS